MAHNYPQMAQKWRPGLRTFSAIFFDWKSGSANFFAFRMYAFTAPQKSMHWIFIVNGRTSKHLKTAGTASPWLRSRSARRWGQTWRTATSSSSTGTLVKTALRWTPLSLVFSGATKVLQYYWMEHPLLEPEFNRSKSPICAALDSDRGTPWHVRFRILAHLNGGNGIFCIFCVF